MSYAVCGVIPASVASLTARENTCVYLLGARCRFRASNFERRARSFYEAVEVSTKRDSAFAYNLTGFDIVLQVLICIYT
jgi:hypothetical protein